MRTNKRWMGLLFAAVLFAAVLAGCNSNEQKTPNPVSTTSSTVDTSAVSATDSTATTAETQPTSHITTTDGTQTAVTTTTTSASITKDTTTAKITTTTTKSTTATTTITTKNTTTTKGTTTITDPNRVTVNGKVYAVGDTVQYTVYVKTTKNYGTVKIGFRCLQKGLEMPEGTFQKQNQYIMKNIGIGRLGTMPEDTVGNNGFTMTANKGYALDSSVAGNAGLIWYYETTNYDYSAQEYREIDCSNGVALFTIALKITKPGDYTVDCMEYPNKSRSDLTVWGKIS